MRLTVKRLREHILRILLEDPEKQMKPASLMPKKGSASWPQSTSSSPDDVGISARVMRALTDEEYYAFKDQITQKGEEARRRQEQQRRPSRLEKIKKKDDGNVQVPASVLRSLEPEEYEAYIQQLMQHGDSQVTRAQDDDDLLGPDSTNVTGAIRRKKLGLK